MHMAGLSSLGDGVWPSLCQGGHQPLRYQHYTSEDEQILPTHLFLSTPLILHNYTRTTDGTFEAG